MTVTYTPVGANLQVVKGIPEGPLLYLINTTSVNWGCLPFVPGLPTEEPGQPYRSVFTCCTYHLTRIPCADIPVFYQSTVISFMPFHLMTGWAGDTWSWNSWFQGWKGEPSLRSSLLWLPSRFHPANQRHPRPFLPSCRANAACASQPRSEADLRATKCQMDQYKARRANQVLRVHLDLQASELTADR